MKLEALLSSPTRALPDRLAIARSLVAMVEAKLRSAMQDLVGLKPSDLPVISFPYFDETDVEVDVHTYCAAISAEALTRSLDAQVEKIMQLPAEALFPPLAVAWLEERPDCDSQAKFLPVAVSDLAWRSLYQRKMTDLDFMKYFAYFNLQQILKKLFRYELKQLTTLELRYPFNGDPDSPEFMSEYIEDAAVRAQVEREQQQAKATYDNYQTLFQLEQRLSDAIGWLSLPRRNAAKQKPLALRNLTIFLDELFAWVARNPEHTADRWSEVDALLRGIKPGASSDPEGLARQLHQRFPKMFLDARAGTVRGVFTSTAAGRRCLAAHSKKLDVGVKLRCILERTTLTLSETFASAKHELASTFAAASDTESFLAQLAAEFPKEYEYYKGVVEPYQTIYALLASETSLAVISDSLSEKLSDHFSGTKQEISRQLCQMVFIHPHYSQINEQALGRAMWGVIAATDSAEYLPLLVDELLKRHDELSANEKVNQLLKRLLHACQEKAMRVAVVDCFLQKPGFSAENTSKTSEHALEMLVNLGIFVGKQLERAQASNRTYAPHECPAMNVIEQRIIIVFERLLLAKQLTLAEEEEVLALIRDMANITRQRSNSMASKSAFLKSFVGCNYGATWEAYARDFLIVGADRANSAFVQAYRDTVQSDNNKIAAGNSSNNWFTQLTGRLIK